MKVEIKNRFSDEVIFLHEQEGNSMKITVVKAFELKSDLSWADLSRSNLSGSNLNGSNLSGSNLNGSNLSGSNLSGSNLSWANLSRSNLSGSNLSGSNLSGAIGNMKQVFSAQLGTWMITFTKTMLFIGCQAHSIKKWKSFTDEEISAMDTRALPWWKKWKDLIFKMIELAEFKD